MFCRSSLLAVTAPRMVVSRSVLIITSMGAVGRSRMADVRKGYIYVPAADRAATMLRTAPRRSDYLLTPLGRAISGNCPGAAQWSLRLGVRSMDRTRRCHDLRMLPQLLLPCLCHSMECRPDGDEPASPVPALHASACAETTPLKRRAADDVKVSPTKVPRAGGPEALAVELRARHMYGAARVLSSLRCCREL